MILTNLTFALLGKFVPRQFKHFKGNSLIFSYYNIDLYF
jgi:hypothetical protein